MKMNRRTFTAPTCEPVYDNDGNVEYYRDCRSSSCPGSDHYSAAQATNGGSNN